MIVLDPGSQDSQCHLVPVVVDRCSAAATGGSAALGICPPSCRLVVAEEAVDHGPRHTDRADATGVRALVRKARSAAECAVRDVDRKSLVLAEDSDRGATDIRPRRVAPVDGEHGVDDLESSTSHPDRPSSIGVEPRRVGICEGQVLDGEPGMVLVLTVRSRPYLGRVARVHVEDAIRAASAQCHRATAVDDDLWSGGVDNLRSFGHHDGVRVRSTIERDDPTLGDGINDRCRGAALRRSSPDHDVRVRNVLRPRLGRHRVGAIGVARQRRLPRRWSDWCEVHRTREERRHGVAFHHCVGAEPIVGRRVAAQGDTLRRNRLDVGLEEMPVVVCEPVRCRSRIAEGTGEHCGHLPSRHHRLGAESILIRRVASSGDPSRREAVDVILEDVPAIIDEEVLTRCRKLQGAREEGSHLFAIDGPVRAESVVDRRIAAFGHADLGDRFDRSLMDVAVVIDERPTPRQRTQHQ